MKIKSKKIVAGKKFFVVLQCDAAVMYSPNKTHQLLLSYLLQLPTNKFIYYPILNYQSSDLI